MKIERWIAEATECDFKVVLETRKPKSWLKSISAFANGVGGTLFFGIDNDRNIIGLRDAQADAEAISRLINLNYRAKTGSETPVTENVAIDVAIDVAIERLTATPNTIQKAKAVFAKVGISGRAHRVSFMLPVR